MGSRFRTRVALILSKVLFLILPRLRSTQRFLSSQLSCRCQDMTGCFRGLLFLTNDMPAKLHRCSREVQRNSQHLREKGLEGMWGDSVHLLPRAPVAVLSTRGNVFRSTEVPFSLTSSLCYVGSRHLGRIFVLNKSVFIRCWDYWHISVFGGFFFCSHMQDSKYLSVKSGIHIAFSILSCKSVLFGWDKSTSKLL